MKLLNALLLSAMLTLVAVPVAFGCPCQQNASNEDFLRSVGKNPDFKVTESLKVRNVQ